MKKEINEHDLRLIDQANMEGYTSCINENMAETEEGYARLRKICIRNHHRAEGRNREI